MINLLLGAPGGGKSYEAVAFHVIPALADGRKVITNLPLVLDQFPPEQRSLLDLRSAAKGKREKRAAMFGSSRDDGNDEVFTRAFSTVECYGDPWRHPENGTGPLYVIDECHLCLPREDTGRKVREWYSLHRHELADVLLITQSHGKVAKDVIDLVQVCYRVRKATAFGSNSGYIRKVFDGVRGDLVNTAVRKYHKRFFAFYKSHTKSSKAGAELAANDIVPLWKRWPFIGLALCVVLFIAILSSGRDMNPMNAPKTQHVAAAPKKPLASTPVHVAPASQVPEGARKDEHADRAPGSSGAAGRQVQNGHPFAGLGIHVMGRVGIGGREIYAVAMSQNGQRVFTTSSDELKEAGYKVKRISDCAMGLTYGDVEIVAVCDAPAVAVTPGDSMGGDKPKRVDSGAG